MAKNGKKIMLMMLALSVTQVFAQTNCTEQYSGGYHCLNYETGQTTNIHVTPYHGTTVQPLEMPDISTLPNPTPMMQMDNNQTNDLLNPQLSFEPNVW